MAHVPQMGISEILINGTAATAATSTANFDCDRGAYAEIFVVLRAGSTASTTSVSLLESDDTVVSNFATVVADQTLAHTSSASRMLRYEVDMRGRKRYLRLSVTPTAGGQSTTIAAVGVLHNAFEGPGSTTGMNASTNDVAVIVT